ncbi:MAG: hypothetical protein EZS28_006935 [Streblomastix strix]|uniref:Uncharacterized protein n=1 Tax=Streblomastix strix TaxID=222440 RepID=A0A5J4WRW0_9EUKA|nr:MAG: hypothetical protein EZS28_006935 [Streblomastix strix]
MQSFLQGLSLLNLVIVHLRIQVLESGFIAAVRMLVFQLQKLDWKAGLPIELGAGGVNKLDYQVYYNPKDGGFYINNGRPSMMLGYLYNYMLQPEEGWVYQKRPGYGKPQNCCNPWYIPNHWNVYYIYGLGINYPEQNSYIIWVGVNVTSCGI